MKIHFVILFAFLSFPSFSQVIRKDSIYQSHDSTIEIKTWVEQHLVREFIRVEGKELIYYKEFDLKTQQLKTDGLLENGFCSGTWKFYKKKSKPDHQIKFEVTNARSYTHPSDPYDDVFKRIKQNCDSVLEQKKAKNCNFFFHFHSSLSYYYHSSFGKNWSAAKDIQPNAFLVRYDLVFADEPLFRTFAYVELELDSIGNITKENYSSLMTDHKNVDFISMGSAATIALKNGLTDAEQPFEFKFLFIKEPLPSKKGKICLQVMSGHPFDSKEDFSNNVSSTILYFHYVNIDPWTGKVISSGISSIRKEKFL